MTLYTDDISADQLSRHTRPSRDKKEIFADQFYIRMMVSFSFYIFFSFSSSSSSILVCMTTEKKKTMKEIYSKSISMEGCCARISNIFRLAKGLVGWRSSAAERCERHAAQPPVEFPYLVGSLGFSLSVCCVVCPPVSSACDARGFSFLLI